MSVLLRFERILLRRGGRTLFDGLDLELGAGGALLLAGPNGCGKSSLIRLAAGLVQPQSGRVERARLALADDALALDGELPLRRALGFWTGLNGHAGRTDQALAAFGLTGLADVPVRLLSSGQLRRATLARVQASGAPLWLLDEPLNGLDQSSVERLARAVEAHRASGGAVLAASHAPLAGQWSRLDLEAEAAR